MPLDALLDVRKYVRGIAALDVLLDSDPLYYELQHYILKLKTEGKTPATIEIYTRMICDLISTLKSAGVRDIAKIREEHIQIHFIALEERGQKPASRHVAYRSLRTFFNWAKKKKYVTDSPMEDLRAPKIPDEGVIPFTQDDIARLLAVTCYSRFTEVRNRALVLMFLDTGLRLEECANITLSDLSQQMDTVRVMGKGQKARTVGIGRATREALIDYLEFRRRRPDAYDALWVTEERTPLSKDGIATTIRRLCELAGITRAHRGPHTLRHTFATMAFMNGASEGDVQILLGHSTPKMTYRYSHTVRGQIAVQHQNKFSPVDGLIPPGR